MPMRGLLDKPSVFIAFSMFVSICYSMHECQPVVAVQIGVMAENSSHELSGVARKKFQLGRIFNDKLN
jgi:hypothetical protein